MQASASRLWLHGLFPFFPSAALFCASRLEASDASAHWQASELEAVGQHQQPFFAQCRRRKSIRVGDGMNSRPRRNESSLKPTALFGTNVFAEVSLSEKPHPVPAHQQQMEASDGEVRHKGDVHQRCGGASKSEAWFASLCIVLAAKEKATWVPDTVGAGKCASQRARWHPAETSDGSVLT